MLIMGNTFKIFTVISPKKSNWPLLNSNDLKCGNPHYFATTRSVCVANEQNSKLLFLVFKNIKYWHSCIVLKMARKKSITGGKHGMRDFMVNMTRAPGRASHELLYATVWVPVRISCASYNLNEIVCRLCEIWKSRIECVCEKPNKREEKHSGYGDCTNGAFECSKQQLLTSKPQPSFAVKVNDDKQPAAFEGAWMGKQCHTIYICFTT